MTSYMGHKSISRPLYAAGMQIAGKNEKAVRPLALLYGGGKTHTLITPYHLVSDPKKLPNVSAMREFKEAFGSEPPHARVAALSFDKLK